MPKISIIVPVYNVEDYLPRCLNSILKQTIQEIEIILINDGSTDSSGDICDQFALKDSRITVIHQKNGGLPAARNEGIAHASGDYIGFIDSDDYIEADMYEKLYRACTQNNAKISMCGRHDVAPDGRKKATFTLKEPQIWSSKEAIRRILLWENIDSSACDKLFARAFFSEFRFPLGKYHDDIFFVPPVVHAAGKIVHIGEPKYNYYYRENSISKEPFSVRKWDLLEAVKSVETLILKEYPELQKEYDSFYYHNLLYLNSLLQAKNIRKKFEEEYRQLYKKLLAITPKAIVNPYITSKSKLKGLLILLKSYDLAENIEKRLRNGTNG